MNPNTLHRTGTATTWALVVMGLAACGGGGDDTAAQDLNVQANSERSRALARVSTPPPPPPPPVDGTLVLASANAAGQAALGMVCGLSSDGGKVAFGSASSNLVSGDGNGLPDIFLKDFNGNGVTRIVTAATANGANCLALTPNAQAVAYVADAGSGVISVLGFEGQEPAIFVKNLGTGLATRVTPRLSTFANVSRYDFAGLSDDGLRVAFIAQPTRTCSGYDCTANGPARMLLRDLSTGALTNLESQVRFTTSQGVASGNARLAPNGASLAFASKVAYPQAGDANVDKSDVFLFDIASGAVSLVNTQANGAQAAYLGLSTGPNFGVQGFLAGGSKVVYRASFDTAAGLAGVYVKDRVSASLSRVLGLEGNVVGDRAELSFSADGRKVAFIVSSGNTSTGTSVPRVLDLSTGASINAATLSNGTVGNGFSTAVSLSADGRAAGFSSTATNLVAGTTTSGLRAYRKLVP